MPAMLSVPKRQMRVRRPGSLSGLRTRHSSTSSSGVHGGAHLHANGVSHAAEELYVGAVQGACAVPDPGEVGTQVVPALAQRRLLADRLLVGQVQALVTGVEVDAAQLGDGSADQGVEETHRALHLVDEVQVGPWLLGVQCEGQVPDLGVVDVCEAAGEQAADEVDSHRRAAVGFDEIGCVGTSGLFGEGDAIDQVPAVAGKRHAVAGLDVRGARLGVLAGDASDPHDLLAAAVDQYGAHHEEHLELGVDEVGATIREAFGAVTALQQEALTPSRFSELLLELFDLPARHDGRQPGQSVQRALQLHGIVVRDLLLRGSGLPGVRAPGGGHGVLRGWGPISARGCKARQPSPRAAPRAVLFAMLFAWLLPLCLSPRAVAMVPVTSDVSVGPPAAHLDLDPAVQWRLSARPAWRAFRQRWGGLMQWDPRDGLPHFWYGSGVPASEVDDLVADLAGLAGVAPSDLQWAGDVVDPPADGVTTTRHLLRWQQTWHGVPVEGGEVLVVVQAGHIGAAWVRLMPVSLSLVPRPGELVFGLPMGPGRAPRPVLATASREGHQRVYRDRGGRVLYRYETAYAATGQVRYLQRTVGDSMVDGAARRVTVTGADGTVEQTDDDGVHGVDGPVEVQLDGDTLAVSVTGVPVEKTGLRADFDLVGGEDITQSAASVQHHFYVVWDWLTDRWPTHRWLGDHVRATVEADGYCNAYYNSGTINFYRALLGSCNDLGDIADVIYHETGHGIHEYILAGGTFAGDVSEGSADYISATINDDPYVGVNAWGTGTAIRQLETDRIYPDDVTGEVHNDGLIWGSFMWNLREQWSDTYGADEGVTMADELFLGTLQQGPTLTDLAPAVLVADDDDGDLSNGTPHACELLDLLVHHGLASSSMGVVILDYAPLGPQASDTDGYEIDADVYDLTPTCSGLDPDSPTVWYTLDDNLALPARPTVDASGWNSLPLTGKGGAVSAVIPRQPANGHVRYFLTASSLDGTDLVSTADGDLDKVYAFWVGDRQALWCEDFEAGAPGWIHSTGLSSTLPGDSGAVDQWQVGSPDGVGAWDPPAAWEGDGIAGVNLDGDYQPDDQQYLQAPEVRVKDSGLMLLLSFERWLTVEDGLYDSARLYNGEQLLWANPATEGGSEDTLDVDWTHQDLPMADHLGAGGLVDLRWSLSSDSGLEFGGWQLDHVCMVQLDDLDRHYRAGGLEASDDQPDRVTISWANPWVQPLQTTVLVARQDTWPTGPDDGRLVAVDFAPHWGDAVEVDDTFVAPGEQWHYALFSAEGDGEKWHTSLVEGDNADVGGIPADMTDTGDTGTSDGGAAADTGDGGSASDGGSISDGGTDTGVLGKRAGGCACSSFGGEGSVPGAAWGLVGLLGLARRRRR